MTDGTISPSVANMQDILNEDAVGCVPLYYGDDVLTAWINYLLTSSSTVLIITTVSPSAVSAPREYK